MLRPRSFVLRLSTAEHERLAQLAADAGLSMAEYLRHLVDASTDGEDARTLLTRSRTLIDRAMQLLN